MRAVTVLLVALAGSARAVDDGFFLHMLDASTGALCLDGTPGGFYMRPGSGAGVRSWILHFEGGGWCVDEADCVARSLTPIGSSTSWPEEGLPTMDGGAHGSLSNDSTINPAFWNWNMVHVQYCDGASYAGNVASPVNVNGTLLHFRGSYILEAVFAKLLTMGLATATDLVISGTSAGGLAVYLHLDRIRAIVPASVRVVGMPDAGFFLDIPNWLNQPVYTPIYQYVSKMQNVSGTVNAGCAAAHNASTVWQCFFADYTFPFIETPMFIFNSLADTWQLANILQLPCYNNVPSCTAPELAALQDFRTTLLERIQPAIASPTTGLFLQTCLIHAEVNSDTIWPGTLVQNQTMVGTFLAWYHNTAGVNTKVVDCAYPCNTHCHPWTRSS